ARIELRLAGVAASLPATLPAALRLGTTSCASRLSPASAPMREPPPAPRTSSTLPFLTSTLAEPTTTQAPPADTLNLSLSREKLTSEALTASVGLRRSFFQERLSPATFVRVPPELARSGPCASGFALRVRKTSAS